MRTILDISIRRARASNTLARSPTAELPIRPAVPRLKEGEAEEGMENCTHLPRITEASMRKGYSDDDTREILVGNLLRVMEANEREMRAAR